MLVQYFSCFNCVPPLPDCPESYGACCARRCVYSANLCWHTAVPPCLKVAEDSTLERNISPMLHFPVMSPCSASLFFCDVMLFVTRCRLTRLADNSLNQISCKHGVRRTWQEGTEWETNSSQLPILLRRSLCRCTKHLLFWSRQSYDRPCFAPLSVPSTLKSSVALSLSNSSQYPKDSHKRVWCPN